MADCGGNHLLAVGRTENRGFIWRFSVLNSEIGSIVCTSKEVIAVVIFTRTLFAGCLLTVAAHAGPITLNNPSFEIAPLLTIPCGVGCQYDTPGSLIPGWTYTVLSNAGGQWQPGSPANPTYFSVPPPDGTTIAYLSSGAVLSQMTSAAVQLGVTYTLNVDVGINTAVSPYSAPGGLGQVLLQILGGPTIVAIGVAPPKGTFSTYTATYIGLPADVGKEIEVSLADPSSGTATFDNVRLADSSVAGVPEPASVALIGAGLAAIALYRRSRAKKIS
jgi:PEP-CTERM motif